MPTFETNLPVKPVQGTSVVSVPLHTALANPVPVINPNNGVTVTPIPPAGVFTVPLDVLTGGGR